MSDGEYIVYQWFRDGSREDALRFVGAEQAVRCAVGLATSVGARIGTTVEVMITDGGDSCNWHWKREEGVLFPKEHAGMLRGGIRSAAT